MHLKVKPSEEKLPQVKETDVDIAAGKLRELVQKEAKCIAVAAHLRTSFVMSSVESASFVL
jgi:hypothetical protein